MVFLLNNLFWAIAWGSSNASQYDYQTLATHRQLPWCCRCPWVTMSKSHQVARLLVIKNFGDFSLFFLVISLIAKAFRDFMDNFFPSTSVFDFSQSNCYREASDAGHLVTPSALFRIGVYFLSPHPSQPIWPKYLEFRESILWKVYLWYSVAQLWIGLSF